MPSPCLSRFCCFQFPPAAKTHDLQHLSSGSAFFGGRCGANLLQTTFFRKKNKKKLKKIGVATVSPSRRSVANGPGRHTPQNTPNCADTPRRAWLHLVALGRSTVRSCAQHSRARQRKARTSKTRQCKARRGRLGHGNHRSMAQNTYRARVHFAYDVRMHCKNHMKLPGALRSTVFWRSEKNTYRAILHSAYEVIMHSLEHCGAQHFVTNRQIHTR